MTADGNTKNIVFIEERIEAAPQITGWKFTALKPALDIKGVSIEMSCYKFNEENLSFYSNELPAYRDEIDITIIHRNLTGENKKQIIAGIYIFLDNYLFHRNAQRLPGLGAKKEFVEKYEGPRHDTAKANTRGHLNGLIISYERTGESSENLTTSIMRSPM